jgi:predicted phosphodiesterase
MAKLGLDVGELERIRSFVHPLPIELDERRILISHGSPWDINEYLYPNVDLKVWDRFDEYDFEVFVVGHTHHQMIKRIGNKVVINPGSVGQSRSTKGSADWALLSLADLSVTFHSTPYNSRPLLEQCQKLDPGLQLLSRHLI